MNDPDHPSPGPEKPSTENVTYVSFSAEVSQQTTEALLGVMAGLANKKVDTVHLLFTTPGGRVDNGIALYNLLKAMPFKLVTHNVGSVNSIGNVVFLAGDERYASENATFMFHGVGFDITNPMRWEEKNLRERLDSLQADQRKIASVLVARTGIGDDEAADLFLEAKTKDVSFALEKGIIHEIREILIPKGAPLIQLVFKR